VSKRQGRDHPRHSVPLGSHCAAVDLQHRDRGRHHPQFEKRDLLLPDCADRRNHHRRIGHPRTKDLSARGGQKADNIQRVAKLVLYQKRLGAKQRVCKTFIRKSSGLGQLQGRIWRCELESNRRIKENPRLLRTGFLGVSRALEMKDIQDYIRAAVHQHYVAPNENVGASCGRWGQALFEFHGNRRHLLSESGRQGSAHAQLSFESRRQLIALCQAGR
jgi:hypothetical protein